MPLTHLVSTAACLLAAAVMLVHARDRASRAAHLVMLAAMVALGLWMQSPVAVAAVAAVLCVAGLLVLRRRDHARRAAAIDSVACAVMLVAAAWSMAAMSRPDGSGSMSGAMPGSMSGAMDMSARAGDAGGTGSPLLVVITVLLGWALVSWFLTPRRSPLGWGAGLLMLAGMGAMGLV